MNNYLDAAEAELLEHRTSAGAPARESRPSRALIACSVVASALLGAIAGAEHQRVTTSLAESNNGTLREAENLPLGQSQSSSMGGLAMQFVPLASLSDPNSAPYSLWISAHQTTDDLYLAVESDPSNPVVDIAGTVDGLPVFEGDFVAESGTPGQVHRMATIDNDTLPVSDATPVSVTARLADGTVANATAQLDTSQSSSEPGRKRVVISEVPGL